MARFSGNAILLKAGFLDDGKVRFKVFDTEAKATKTQKTWSKKRGIECSCDAVTLIDGRREMPLDIVARIPRVCSIVEGREMKKRFEDQ